MENAYLVSEHGCGIELNLRFLVGVSKLESTRTHFHVNWHLVTRYHSSLTLQARIRSHGD